MDLFNLSTNSNFGLKSQDFNISNQEIVSINKNINDRHNDDPILKATYPIYLYKPPFGYPRNVNVVFLRELSKNPYVFSVLKAISDQAAESKWQIKPKEGVEMTQELFKSKKSIEEFFKNPNSDNESFSTLLRKIIPDILVLDSGVFNKVYNKKGELLQLRVIDGGAILKNPNANGSIADKTNIIFNDGYNNLPTGQGFNEQKKAYKLALDQYNAYGYDQEAAYFQFAYGVNYSVPIPYGKDEIVYLMENPATETVYSRSSALQSAVDITLNLIYSSKASLDLFLNANIPSGIIQLAEANNTTTKAFQDQLHEQQYSGYDEYGLQRKINGKIPVVGNPNVSFIPLNFSNSENKVLEIQEWFTKVLWSCFGVTASEMGFTKGDSRATDESQTEVNARKAVKPRLSMIANHLNDQVMPELPNGDLFEFTFDVEQELDEKTRWEIYEKKIQLGVMTPEQVAQKEGIEYEGQDINQRDNNLDDEEFKSNEDPCWEGYEQYGTKMENGKEVPNCVPIQSKSMNTQSGGEGITDTPLVPVENKKEIQDIIRVDDLVDAIDKELEELKKNGKSKTD